VGPEAAVVAIENRTGEIKAMVGGSSFERRPFNLATNGHRQPGSAFKPFTLIAALEQGVSPDAVFTSQPKVFPVPGSTQEKFVVHNHSNSYAGVASLRSATATSDNSVYAELGLRVGTRRIARVARQMGVRTPISTNPSMTLGGLEHGLSPLELAYAYSTIANKGLRVSGSLAPGGEGPVGIERVEGSGIKDGNERRTKRVFDATIGETAQQLLAGVISGGTGRAAAIGEFAAGKTGTTENYGDAWFVGFNEQLTVAVWVGYPDGLRPMETEFGGSPVAGGTYPAEIWHDVLTAWIRIRQERAAAKGDRDQPTGVGTLPVPATPLVPSVPQSGLPTTPTPGTGAQGAPPAQTAPVQPQAAPVRPQSTPAQPVAPKQPTPTPSPPASAAPQQQAQPPAASPTQPPSSGGAAGAPSG
jgi:penicillin-binding protein 1A